MSTYELKDKIKITKDFLNDLEVKSWQDIEHLQYQIENIETTKENIALVQLLKNLLTSYYVFIGGLENLTSDASLAAEDCAVPNAPVETTEVEVAVEPKGSTDIELNYKASYDEVPDNTKIHSTDFEPFEYFVDFDEPSGEPISDEDLYGN
jgi:hypothetical protein